MPSLQCLVIIAVIILASEILASRSTNLAFIPINKKIQQRHSIITTLQQSTKKIYSADLDTAYEYLSKDRFEWFDPTDTNYIKTDTDINYEVKRMPLYPLGAVHVPHSGENHTLINIEPKNVKMAMDIVNGQWEDNLFCTSLRARDTNRIASVGTIMQLVDTEDRSISGARTWPGELLPTLNRVVVNCKSVGVVDIISIEENDYGNDDYLIANVKVHPLPKEESDTDNNANHKISEELDAIAQQVIEDYQQVRSKYINSASLANNELPKFARSAVETLPTFSCDDVHNENHFWKLIETWQMLCNTIRQSKQTNLQSIVNELSVTVAMQAKGPLELPVKRKSLPIEVQHQLESLEESAARDFIELGMDPILCFQELISLTDHWDRVTKLSHMIRRERYRLEAKESLIRALLGEESFPADTNMDDDNSTSFD